VEALQKNELAGDSDLFIFSDATKHPNAAAVVQEVREYIKTVGGFKSVSIVERDTNLGLANSIIEGVTKVCDEHGKVIVVEDDLVTSPYFLSYMNDALNLYEHDESVISIHGYMYPVEEMLPVSFFLKQADCWGWATWKRGWDLFETDGAKLLAELKRKKLTQRFDLDGAVPYTKMLIDQIAGENNSWAIRWQAAAFLANRFTLFPGISLVRNIGFDDSGTHCSESSSFDVALANAPVQISAQTVKECDQARTALIRYYRAQKRSILVRIKRRIYRAVGIKI
jgi:hypothetical protein